MRKIASIPSEGCGWTRDVGAVRRAPAVWGLVGATIFCCCCQNKWAFRVENDFMVWFLWGHPALTDAEVPPWHCGPAVLGGGPASLLQLPPTGMPQAAGFLPWVGAELTAGLGEDCWSSWPARQALRPPIVGSTIVWRPRHRPLNPGVLRPHLPWAAPSPRLGMAGILRQSQP